MSMIATPRQVVAHVSTFHPLRCGIASFAEDLISATPDFDHIRYALVYGGAASSAAKCANVNSPAELAELATTISESDCGVVTVQHEFGIWGGSEGENIHAFLDNLTKPMVTVLHTTFGPGARSDRQSQIVRRLIEQSVRSIVFTPAAKSSLEALLGRPSDRIVAILHGVPDLPFVEPSEAWTNGLPSRSHALRVITPGFFREDKGFETVLLALRELRASGVSVEYRIVGEPQEQFKAQARYCVQIESLIESLGLEDVASIDTRYLSVSEQAEAIRWAHVGVFAYQNPIQASSGTVPLVLSMGRPVVCTPFEYARAKHQEGPGVILADGFDPGSVAEALMTFIRMARHSDFARSTYDRMRNSTWAYSGAEFGSVWRSCV